MGRAAILLLLAGMCCLGIGGLFKIQHWPFANALLGLSCSLLPIGAALIAVAVYKNKGLAGVLDPTHDPDPR